MLLIQNGGVQNVMTQTWLCDSESEIANIPEGTPSGSMVLILNNNDGLSVKMKNNAGNWVDI